MTEDRRSSGRPAPVMLSGSALALGLVALVAEIVLFAAIGQLAHHHAGGGVTGIVVAVVVLALAAVLWGVFMAPNSPRRISLRPRVALGRDGHGQPVPGRHRAVEPQDKP